MAAVGWAWDFPVSVASDSSGPRGADVQAAFAATLVDEWARDGVTHAVVCPGSRSSPLAVALAAHPDLAVHVRLDERSAGFTGVGLGLATGRPAVVLTTSGTAAAELHAAVVEADLARVPLIVCTADRPPELRDVGAPQTIDQLLLYGGSVRWFADPGVAATATRATWRSLAARAVAEATSGSSGPGPVHVNLPFREPLLGDAAAGGGLSPGRQHGAPWHVVGRALRSPDEWWIRRQVEAGRLRPGTRGLVVAGAGCGEPGAILAMAGALGWPVLADPRSGLRQPVPGVIGAADAILRSQQFADRHVPETIVRLGDRWVSKVVNQFVSRSIDEGATCVMVDPLDGWSDPEHEVADFVRADPGLFAVEVTRQARALPPAAAPAGPWSWPAEWQEAEERAGAVIRDRLGRTSGAGGLTEPSLAHRVYAGLPDDATLVVSSSMPVRDIESFAGPRSRPPRVLSNRGANGIDGVVSTAIGVALAGGGPTVALVGDLAFLHDVSALASATGRGTGLTVVVADNGGGGIFSFLPQAGALPLETFEQLFGTPQDPDIGAVATGFGWPVDEVGGDAGPGALEEALAARIADGTRSVIRVRLPGRPANVERHRELNDAIVRAVDGPGGPASPSVS